jgi:DMSO/TMAO reductase YedYZ molybdopterin-dependent catalytic subunit
MRGFDINGGDEMSFMSRWIKVLGAGLLAGLVAALLMTVIQALMRLLLGVPLPGELGGDRFLPTFNVTDFLHLLKANGGTGGAKRKAFYSGFGGQLAFGVAFGMLYAFVTEIGRARNPERERRFGVGPGSVLLVVISVIVIWTVSLAVLWPTLSTNNRGLTPALASITTGAGFLIVYASFGIALILIYRFITNRRPLRESTPVGEPIARRSFLAGAGGLVLAVASGGLIKKLHDDSTLLYDGKVYTGASVKHITPNDEFYVVTKNIIDPVVRKAAWRLRIDGLVDNPRTYSFDDLASMPSVKQEMTLECISNHIGQGLMSNAIWTGVSLKKLVEAAGPKQGAVDVILHAADGYTHDVSFDKVMEETTLLAYEMNGEPLPDHHGYPVRALVPGYYGEGSAKWINRVEIFDRNVDDRYYGKQGWIATHVSTTSQFDPDRFDPQLPAKVGKTTTLKGIAYSGDRSMDKVEVSTDGGANWQEAKIDYSPSKIAWVFWSYDWTPKTSGDARLVVRATDGEGKLQTPKVTPANPDGASGFDRQRVPVKG